MKKTFSSSRKKDKDPSFYDGPSKSQVYDSFVELYTDLITDLGDILGGVSISMISLWISKFLNGFWKQSKSCISGQEVKTLAEQCKSRRNDLLDVLNEIIHGHAPAFPGDIFLLDSSSLKKVVDLKYYPNSFRGVVLYLEEVNEILSFIELKGKPGFYVYLYKIAFHIIAHANIDEQTFLDNKEKIIQILLLSVSLGQVYEHMNPSPDIMDEYGLNLLNQLKQESKNPSKEFWDLFYQVAEDISQPPTKNNVYIRDIQHAIKRFKHSNKEFKINDYYLTAKASTSKITVRDSGKKLSFKSIFSSILETDPIKDQPEIIEFDNYCNYQSGYLNDYEIPSHLEVSQNLVVTSMIPNPSKYKPRGIHVGCNAIQDRCKYLHRHWSNILNRLPYNCMDSHYKGVEFLIRVTEPNYRAINRNNVFVSDFSNATDTLNQEFQCKVIEVFTNKTFSDLWEFISSLPKCFRLNKDKSLIPYIQSTGQPQGLLGSFDAFSLAHIFLILMLMKKFKLEHYNAADTFAIVGDDSVISYPSELEDNDNLIETFYAYHSWLCDEVSLIKNDSKTAKSFYHNNGNFGKSVLDFAKVSICDGVNMTPLPYGLASSYTKKRGSTDLEVIFWLNSKGLTYKQLCYKLIYKAYSNKLDQMIAVMSVLSSGEIPFFKEFEDEDLFNSIDSSIRGLSHFMFYQNGIEHTFLGSVLSGEEKHSLNSPSFSTDCFGQLEKEFLLIEENVTEDFILSLPKKHKYQIMLDHNLNLALDLQDLIDFREDTDDLAVCLAVLINEDYESLFQEYAAFRKCLLKAQQDNSQEIWQFLSFQQFSHLKDLTDPLKGFQIKSMKEVSSRSTLILLSTARKTRKFIKDSTYLSDCMIDSYATVTDEIIKISGLSE